MHFLLCNVMLLNGEFNIQLEMENTEKEQIAKGKKHTHYVYLKLRSTKIVESASAHITSEDRFTWILSLRLVIAAFFLSLFEILCFCQSWGIFSPSLSANKKKKKKWMSIDIFYWIPVPTETVMNEWNGFILTECAVCEQLKNWLIYNSRRIFIYFAFWRFYSILSSAFSVIKICR